MLERYIVNLQNTCEVQKKPGLNRVKASKSRLGHFPFYCPFKGGYFSTVDLEMHVRVRLLEVSAYGTLKGQYPCFTMILRGSKTYLDFT